MSIIKKSITELENKADKISKDCPHLAKSIEKVVVEIKTKFVLLTYIEEERQN